MSAIANQSAMMDVIYVGRQSNMTDTALLSITNEHACSKATIQRET